MVSQNAPGLLIQLSKTSNIEIQNEAATAIAFLSEITYLENDTVDSMLTITKNLNNASPNRSRPATVKEEEKTKQPKAFSKIKNIVHTKLKEHTAVTARMVINTWTVEEDLKSQEHDEHLIEVERRRKIEEELHNGIPPTLSKFSKEHLKEETLLLEFNYSSYYHKLVGFESSTKDGGIGIVLLFIIIIIIIIVIIIHLNNNFDLYVYLHSPPS